MHMGVLYESGIDATTVQYNNDITLKQTIVFFSDTTRLIVSIYHSISRYGIHTVEKYLLVKERRMRTYSY